VGEFLLVPAYPGSPGPTAVKGLCVCVRVYYPSTTVIIITAVSAATAM